MPNEFLTPSAIVRDASILAADRLIAGNLVSRSTEATFAEKVGDSVKVTVPPILTASEFEGSTTAQDAQQSEVDVTIEKHLYVRVDLTTKQKTMQLDDFTKNVTVPAVTALGDKIDQYFIRKIAGGFSRNLTGTAGTAPSTAAHIIAGRKILVDNRVRNDGRIALIGSTAEANFLNLAEFKSRDYGDDAPVGLRNAILADRYGLRFVVDPNSGTFNFGDTAGTVLVNGGSQTGASVVVDGFTAATGTVYAGTRFSIAGNSTTYTVIADATIAGNAATLVLDQSLAASPSDNAAVTFKTAHTSDVIYHPAAVAGAIIAPSPLMVNSAIQTFNGLSLRVSMSSSTASLSDSIVYDVYVGSKVIQATGGTIFQG